MASKACSRAQAYVSVAAMFGLKLLCHVLSSRPARSATSVLLLGFVAGCATYREDLNRGQRLYEENQYEHALAIWRNLEPDFESLSFKDQARYTYLRGITDYRLGFRADARHWLAVARAIEQEHPGGLQVEWKQRLESSLEDLNKEVFAARQRVASNPASASGGASGVSAPASPAPP